MNFEMKAAIENRNSSRDSLPSTQIRILYMLYVHIPTAVNSKCTSDGRLDIYGSLCCTEDFEDIFLRYDKTSLWQKYIYDWKMDDNAKGGLAKF